MSIAQALADGMIRSGEKRAWAGNPDLLLTAYEAAGGKILHPLDRIAAVIAAVRRSSLFKQDGYIRACDSAGRREVLHPVFVLATAPAPKESDHA